MNTIIEYYQAVEEYNVMCDILQNINKAIVMYEYGDSSKLCQLYDVFLESTDRFKKAAAIENWMKTNNYGDPHGNNPSKAQKAMRMRNYLIQHDFDPVTETIAVPGTTPNSPPRRMKFLIDKFIKDNNPDGSPIIDRMNNVEPGYLPEAKADIDLIEQRPPLSISDIEGSSARQEDYDKRKAAGKLNYTRGTVNFPEHIMMPSKILKDKQNVQQFVPGHETGHADSHAKSPTYQQKKYIKIDDTAAVNSSAVSSLGGGYSINPNVFSKETDDPNDSANKFIASNKYRLNGHDAHPEELHADEFGLKNANMRTKYAGRQRAKGTRQMSPDEAQNAMMKISKQTNTGAPKEVMNKELESVKARGDYLRQQINEFFTFLNNDMRWI